MASSCDRVDCRLALLHLQLHDEQVRFGDKYPGELTVQESKKMKTLNDTKLHIMTFSNEWGFLRTFDYVYQWVDAVKVVQNLGSLIIRIEDVAAEIAEDLSIAHTGEFISKRPSELLLVLHNCQKKIEVLKPEIGEAHHNLEGCSFDLLSPLQDFPLWIKFLKSIEANLKVICGQVGDVQGQGHQISTFVEKMASLRSFLCHILAVFPCSLPSEQFFDDFLIDISSVALRTADLSLFYWFKEVDPDKEKGRIVRLSNMQKQIDPTDMVFLEFNLKFLKALNKFHPSQAVEVVKFFLNYLLCGEGDDGLHKELMSLITFLVNEPEKSSEDMEIIRAEIKMVFRQAGSPDNLLSRGYANDILYFELLSKIWLLKTQIFLKKQLNNSMISMLLAEDQIEDLKEGLENLRRFSKEPEKKLENGKQTLVPIEEVANEVASLSQAFRAKKITRYRVRDSVLVLLLKIVICKAESYIRQLLKSEECLLALGKDQIESLNEHLTLFKMFASVEKIEDVETIFTQIDVVARRIISLCYSLPENEITAEMIEKLIPSFSSLLDKTNILKLKLRKNCPQLPRYNFPKTDGAGFIEFLLGNLWELLERNPNSIAPLKHHIEQIALDVEFLGSLLTNMLKLETEHPELKDLGMHVIDMAYEVEYIVDSIEVDTHWKHFFWFYDLQEKISLVKIKASRISQENNFDATVTNAPQVSTHRISQASLAEIDEVLVPLKDQEEIIIDQLTRGTSQLDVVSIVGMPGIGKTTLAKKVYSAPQLKYHFHIRAWCSVSQEYEKRELLLEILSNIVGLTDDIHQMEDEDLDLKLYQSLKKKRYLIVMDDVWNSTAWHSLASSFPDDGNGSRVLITSRLHDVASEAKSGSSPHSLRLLSERESWKLLQMKVFHEESCPEELSEVGKKIAKNCKGLPLAVVAISGLLEKMDKRQELWENLVESLSSLLIDDPEIRCRGILELSYKSLPDYLKACFLYFGAFLEDKDIPVSKLIWLWVAEGFVQKTSSKSLEDVAEGYLKDLIQRSLVIISKRRSKGKVKACRVHDMLRDLCLSKAKEENFLQLINRYNEPYASFDDLDYGADFDDWFPSNPVMYEKHRLCIYLKRKHFVMSRPSGPITRSLMFFATSDTYPRCPYDIVFIFHHFKLLRVLDLECINMGTSFPSGIDLLVQLRYLAVSGDMDTIPSTISKLWKLETFIVKGLKGKVVLPDAIWCMDRLRHVHVNNQAVFSLEDDDIGNSLHLHNLLTLSSPSLSHAKDSEKILRRLPNLQKLRCIILESWDYSKKCNQFPRFSLLTQLESLKMSYSGRVLDPSELILPLTLKKLTLANFRLPWSHMSAIGRLTNLEVLNLLSRAFEGERWDMREGEFLKLKSLKLESLNLVQWNASSNDLPCLQQLVLRRCKDLEEVPYAFVEVPTLQMIDVQWCGQSTEDSVRRIEEEEIEGLNILINHSLCLRSS